MLSFGPLLVLLNFHIAWVKVLETAGGSYLPLQRDSWQHVLWFTGFYFEVLNRPYTFSSLFISTEYYHQLTSSWNSAGHVLLIPAIPYHEIVIVMYSQSISFDYGV
jgi:hypothetical protein